MRERIASYLPELTALRRDLHAHPELGYREERTAGIIAERLRAIGIDVRTGWGRTGVVGVLSNGRSTRSVALRSEMDALPLEETRAVPYRSVNPGVMHACGHDGHIAMLLGAARLLSDTRNFDGRVVFVFQPAEEGGGGGRLLVREGLFDLFPVQAIYGLHNRSGLDHGSFSTRAGLIMAATDNFQIRIHGQGTHAARPHSGVDPIVAAAGVISALQAVVSREINPTDSAVISITWIESGSAYNIIPDTAVLKGCIRYQDPSVGQRIQEAMERTVAGVCAAHRAGFDFNLIPGYPPVVNTKREVSAALAAARKVVGKDRAHGNGPSMMGSEDFSFYLEKVPGALVFLGAGHEQVIHRSDYDFDDALIPLGVEFWARLVEGELGKGFRG